jgi:DNA helicase-2/ATP-dependent DNA helicase PcrA
MLSSEGDNEDAEASKEVKHHFPFYRLPLTLIFSQRVTISTCHAAKGLEWPVVFIPAVEQGTFPFYRTEDIEEERRLLYVACTRAQGLLYLSHAQKRKMAAETKAKDLSSFIGEVIKQDSMLFDNVSRTFSHNERKDLANVFGRDVPNDEEAERRMKEL